MSECHNRASVLVVEDNRLQRAQLVEELKRFDVCVLTAATASEAIRIATTERPEIVLLDGLVPGMHGFEISRFLRHIGSAYRPFIVIHTAIYKGVRYENEARLKYGVDMYVMKPVRPQNLVEIFDAAARARLKASA